MFWNWNVWDICSLFIVYWPLTPFIFLISKRYSISLFNVCTGLYSCSCLFQFMCMCVHTCVEDRGQLQVLFRNVICILRDRISNQPKAHQIVSNVQWAPENPLFLPPNMGMKIVQHHVQNFSWTLWIELKSPRLQGKCFTNGSCVSSTQELMSPRHSLLTIYPSLVSDKFIPPLDSQCWHASGTHWIKSGHII